MSDRLTLTTEEQMRTLLGPAICRLIDRAETAEKAAVFWEEEATRQGKLHQSISERADIAESNLAYMIHARNLWKRRAYAAGYRPEKPTSTERALGADLA